MFKMIVGRRVNEQIRKLRALYIDYEQNPHNYLEAEPEMVTSDKWGDKLSRPYLRTYVKRREDVMGLEHLGSGAYSDVFAIDDKLAVKIVRREDESYKAFVDFCEREGKNYSCFPRIYARETWSDKEVYVIERLIIDNHAANEAICNIAWQMVAHNDCDTEILTNPFFNFPRDFVEGMAALRRFYEEQSRDLDLHIDLHSNNVALRANGQPVITDPFS